jgi:hypothetical protein
MTAHTVWLNLLLVSEFSEEAFFYSPIDASSMCITLGATNFASLVDFAEENFRQLQVKSGILSVLCLLSYFSLVSIGAGISLMHVSRS